VLNSQDPNKNVFSSSSKLIKLNAGLSNVRLCQMNCKTDTVFDRQLTSDYNFSLVCATE